MSITAPHLRSLVAGLVLCAAAAAETQVDARPVLGAPQRGDGEAPEASRGPAWSRSASRGESLSAAQQLFRRVDTDGDGRLDVRESDHGGIDRTSGVACDVDRDGRLDLGEFTVARQRELARRGLEAAPNLLAESTRIQALWRARTAQLERERAPAGDTSARLERLLGPAAATESASAGRAPESGGPAQARLSDALDSAASQTAERARRAQLLLELRRRERKQQP